MQSLLSVGIDVGTTTTQLIFSRMTVENTAAYFSVPRVDIVAKEVVFTGPIHETPLLDDEHIDAAAVQTLLMEDYAAAGIAPREVATGAVIVTGESARKENARAVAEHLSGMAGDFVVCTAGPDLESLIAGQGSGAQAFSKHNACTVANLDIGGGTTNIAVFKDGDVAARGCYDIGGRLVRLAQDGTIARVSEAAAKTAASLGLPLAAGQPAEAATLSAVARRMADVLDAAFAGTTDPLEEALRTPGSALFTPPPRIDRVCFSGGVADCIHHPPADVFAYRDMGVLLGAAVAQGRLAQSHRLLEGRQTIRATVIGAGTHTLHVSGSTINCAPGVLPVKNLPALCLSKDEEEALVAGTLNLSERVGWFLRQAAADNLLLALWGQQSPSYQRVCQLAAALAGAAAALPPAAPLMVALRADMAKALGHQIESQLPTPRPVVCIDGVHLSPGDYADIGAPLEGGLAVPVVVKTLLFQ